MTNGETRNGWNEWSKHVIRELERLDGCIEDHRKGARDILNQMQVDIATLKVKAGVWGLIGGAIPAAVAIAIILIKSTT